MSGRMRIIHMIGACALHALPAAAEVAHADGDPWCDMQEPGGAFATDCALEVGDTLLSFDYADAGPETTLTFTQTDFDGAALAPAEEIAVEGAAWPPALRDITGDGRPELFVGIYSGMANTDFLVFQPDPDGIYYPTGSLLATSVAGIELRDRLILSTTRDNAVRYVESARLLDRDGFVPVYDMVVDFAERDCRFAHDEGVLAAGLDGEAILAACRSRDWPD